MQYYRTGGNWSSGTTAGTASTTSWTYGGIASGSTSYYYTYDSPHYSNVFDNYIRNKSKAADECLPEFDDEFMEGLMAK